MALEGVPEMTKHSTQTAAQDRGRFSARRKTEAVLRLLRGEDLDTLSRELGVTAATLALAMATLGHDDVAVYDGSWAEWGGHDDYPVETGPGSHGGG